MKKFVGLSIMLAVVAGCAAETPPAASDGVTVTESSDLKIADDVVNPWHEPALVNVEVFEDKLIYTYNAAPARALQVGDVVAGPEGEEGYMREITSVTAISDTVFEVVGDQVGLDRIIEEGSLEVEIDASGDEFIAIDEDLGGRRDALGFSLLPTRVLNGAGACAGAGSGDITFRHDLTYNKPKFKLEFERRGFSIRKAGVSVTGDAELVVVVRAEGDLDVDCMVNVLALLGDAVRPRQIRKRFSILGFINVTVLIKITPRFTTTANITTNDSTNAITVTTTAKAELNGYAGYRSGSGLGADLNVPTSAEIDVDLTGGNVEGFIDAEAGIALAMSVSGLVLPSADVSANARAEFNTDSLACEWDWQVSAEAIAKMYGEVGIDIGFFRRTWGPLNFMRDASYVRSGSGTFDLPYCEGCESDSDCSDDQVCNDGVCQDKPCEEDNDCTPGRMCTGGVCIPEGGDLCSSAATASCGECVDLAGCSLCGGTCTATGDCDDDSQDRFSTARTCEGVDGGRSIDTPCEAKGDCFECVTQGGAFCGWARADGTCMPIPNSNRGLPVSVNAVDWITTRSGCSE